MEFPICYSAEEFRKAHWKIKPLSDNLQAIIEGIQPYNAPALASQLMVYNFNRAIGILHDWARKDRHRQLHVCGAWAANASPKLRFPSGVKIVHWDVVPGCLLEYESEISTFRLDGFLPGMKIDANPNLTIDVALNEVPLPCADSDRLEIRLEAMVRATRHILELFMKELKLKPF